MEQTATSQKESTNDPIKLLQDLKSDVFHDSIDELALGLGRPAEEIEAWIDGSEPIDEDAEFKINRLADERLGEDTSGPDAAGDPEKSTDQRI